MSFRQAARLLAVRPHTDGLSDVGHRSVHHCHLPPAASCVSGVGSREPAAIFGQSLVVYEWRRGRNVLTFPLPHSASLEPVRRPFSPPPIPISEPLASAPTSKSGAMRSNAERADEPADCD